MIASDINKIETEKYPVKTTDQLLQLMGIYYTELEHRDKLFWQQVYTYFFACLVVMLIPFTSIWGLNFGDMLPKIVFPIVGMILAAIFRVVCAGYVVRSEAIGRTYQKLIDMLPAQYRRISVASLDKRKIINMRIASFITWVMFVALIIVGGILIFIATANK